MISILHLLIIWATTQVPVPSDILSGLLLVVVVKTTLFRSLFHINVARKLVAGIKYGGSSFPLDIS